MCYNFKYIFFDVLKIVFQIQLENDLFKITLNVSFPVFTTKKRTISTLLFTLYFYGGIFAIKNISLLWILFCARKTFVWE